MALANKTFRIFVSSTFSDLKEERNALQKYVFPDLKETCKQHGYRFQAIDLRWGVREESALDQQTMNICLDEVARCQRPPNPNFIVLLGDRYGWQPLPVEIPATEYKQIDRQVSNEEDKAILRKWYKRDDNAVPAVYCLQPRKVEVKKNATDIEKKTAQDEERILWNEKTEPSIHKILRNAIKNISLTKEQKLKYISSATEQEIEAGALNVSDAKEHVFGFFRKIEKDIPQEESAKDYIDLIQKGEDWQLDEDAQRKLSELKEELSDKTGEDNIFEYNAKWKGNGVSDDHIEKLCDDVRDSLSNIINKEISLIKDKSPLEQEIEAHKEFGEERAKVFVGRVEILNQIQTYISGADKHPLAVYGESGTGKSTLMAYSLQQTQEKHPDTEIISRFIGVTPESSDGRALLENLCRQISNSYETDGSNIPSEYKDLIDEFPKRLALATAENPLILYLDALDQLSDVDNSRNLTWLPAELPENVKLLVSTLPGECYDALNGKIPEEDIRELQPMPSSEGEELLDLWLKDAKRTLQVSQRKEILDHFSQKNNGNPLYLKLAFEESRKWKSFTEEIKLSPDIMGVIQDLFKRLSKDENHGEMMVSRSLGYLAAAKNGLTEDELIEILSNDLELYGRFLMDGYHIPGDVMEFLKLYIKKYDKTVLRQSNERSDIISDSNATTWFNEEIKKDKNKLTAFLKDAYKESQVNDKFNFFRLPIVLWSRLYFDLEPYLTERSADGASLMTFYHPTTFGAKVKEEYLSGNTKIQSHQGLAVYFENQKLYAERNDGKNTNLRKLSELPFQQTYGNMWNELYDTLTDTEFLEQKNTNFRVFDLINDYRTALEEMPEEDEVGKQRSVIQAFSKALDQASFVLKENPDLTFPQIYNRIKLEQVEQSQDILLSEQLETKRKRYEKPWISFLVGTGRKLSLVRVITGHKKTVYSCAFSPDGKKIVSASKDATLKLWLAETGELINTLAKHQGWIYDCAFSHDGQNIVSVSMDKTIRLWDTASGEMLAMFGSNLYSVLACTFSPDGLCFASGGKDNNVQVWNAKTKEKNHILRGHSDWVTACCFSPGSKRLVSASKDKNLRLWDTLTGENLATLVGHTSDVSGCAFSPNGSQIVSSSYDNTLKLWDAETGRELTTFFGHTNGVHACEFSPDGKQVVSAGEDKTVKLWDAETGRELTTFFGHTSGVHACEFSPDGKQVVSAGEDKSLRIWSTEIGKILAKTVMHEGEVSACKYSPSGQTIVSAGYDHLIKVFNAKSGDVIQTIKGHQDIINDCVISPDSKFIVSGGRDGLRIFNIETGATLFSWNPEKVGWVKKCAVSPDGRRIFIICGVSSFKLFDFETRNVIASNDQNMFLAPHCVFSPDGSYFLSGCRDKTLSLWDAESGGICGIFEGHKGPILAFDFSPDGKCIVSASEDKTLKLWNIETREEIDTFKGHTGWVHNCSFSPDGRQIVSASEDNNLKIWNIKTPKEPATLKGHTGWVENCAFSPDGKTILSTSDDKTLMIWNAETGERLTALIGHTGFVKDCAFSKDGRHIVAGDNLGQIFILSIENIDTSLPITTAIRMRLLTPSRENGTWKNQLQAHCGWCGNRFPVDEKVINALLFIRKKNNLSPHQSPSLRLPNEAWDNPGLLSECPSCQRPIKFNPFFVDNKEKGYGKTGKTK